MGCGLPGLGAAQGEIAVRTMRTAKRLGVKTVAVYSEADATAMHVREADEAVCVGPAASAESYLNIPAIMDAIKQTGAQAVAPGYGFLSENAGFSKELAAHGVEFVGPKERAIAAMGDKIESKEVAKAAGVNTIPGDAGEVHDEEEMLKVANEIGYPVMVKASAGGGGKGMRIAYNDDEAREGYRLSKAEAVSSFASDAMFVEKYIENPRHIEIQVLADRHGNAVYFPERECSIQRRNQKVVEEAPSMCLDDKTRRAMGEQAVQLAKAVNYESAGTVEFLVDPKLNFYFLEMNTRLQVEHPVTEKISRVNGKEVDLVEHMLRIAAGEKLSLKQEDIPVAGVGWAIESRVYAEDPYRKFLPSIGTLTKYKEPVDRHDGDVRIDAGVEEGSEISMHYDPMISKLVTYGKDREAARHLMVEALDSYVIGGVEHNVPLCRDVVTHERFTAGNLSTAFIDEEYPGGFTPAAFTAAEQQQLVASVASLQLIRELRDSSFDESVNQSESFRHPVTGDYAMTIDAPNHAEPLQVGARASIVVDESMDDEAAQSTVLVAVGDEEPTSVATDWSLHDDLFVGDMSSHGETRVQILSKLVDGFRVRFRGVAVNVRAQRPTQARMQALMVEKPKPDLSKMVLAPMPGKVISLNVQAGDKVQPGQEVAIVEAMKMSNSLKFTGTEAKTVKAVSVAAGDGVEVYQMLIELE